MKNSLSGGKTMSYTNAGGSTIPSGRIVKSGHVLGCVVADIAPGATGTIRLEGKYTAPKVSGAVFVAGEKLLFDVSAGSGVGAFDDSVASTALGDLLGAAFAAKAGADGELTCEVILSPGNAELDITA